MDEKIVQLLTLAISAPSGDNCQPWEFIVKDRLIELFNVPERDTSLYNFQQKASLVAHGALIENIQIASSSLGYESVVEVFPDKENPNLVATIDLKTVTPVENPLFPWILKRCTNRRKYHGTPLAATQKAALLQAETPSPGVKIRLATDREAIKRLARAMANNDRLVFENRYLHDFLFEHIRWSDAEARETCDGLDLKTFELGAFDAFGFKMMKNWSLVEKLNRFGTSKMVAKQAEKLCLSASGIGVVTVPGSSEKEFLLGGRAMQRLWLEATRQGLGFQPLAGIAFLMQRVMAGATGELSSPQVKLIAEVRDAVSQQFNLGQEQIVMLFRLGMADPPTARSLRMPLDKTIMSA